MAKTEEARKARHEQYKKHGDRGAVDAAIGKITGGDQKPARRPQEARTAPQPPAKAVYAEESESAKLDPTQAGKD